MKKVVGGVIFGMLCGMGASSLFADQDVAPAAVSISKQDLAGGILDGGILEGETAVSFMGNAAKSVTVYKSSDEAFSVGVFGMTVEDEANGKHRYENFPKFEVMYFLEGTMTLIDDNGNVTKAGPGEVLVIPKGWSGTRITTSIKKVSVVSNHNPDDH